MASESQHQLKSLRVIFGLLSTDQSQRLKERIAGDVTRRGIDSRSNSSNAITDGTNFRGVKIR